MKKNLIILGAGPRGIACAIQALLYKDKFNIYIIDPDPISTWKFPNIVVDMRMRSPITFDLVTYCKDLDNFSLTNFLKQSAKKGNQQTIESNTTFCKRKDFVDYLNNCLDILTKEGVNLIKRKPASITPTEVIFSNTSLKYTNLIVASGKYTEEKITPNYLKGLTTCVCKDIYTTDWDNKTIYVIGSGQFSAEIVDYISDNVRATTYWVTKHKEKVSQYPLPSYKDWKKFSALSTYYYKNKYIDLNGQEYINLAKSWGPTITPYISDKLKTKNTKFGILTPKQILLNQNSIYLLALGRKQNLYKLPFEFRFPNSYYRQNVPNLSKEFNSFKYPHIYFTGQLAVEVGGPQQGSIISSGFTGEKIIKSILSYI